MQLLLCKNRRAEVKVLFDHLLLPHAEGTSAPASISIVASSLATYLPVLKTYARYFRLPVNYETQVSLANSPTWGVLWQLHECWQHLRDDRPVLSVVQRLLKAHLLPISNVEQLALQQTINAVPWNADRDQLRGVLPEVYERFLSLPFSNADNCAAVLLELMSWLPENLRNPTLTLLLTEFSVSPEIPYALQLTRLQEEIRQTIITEKEDSSQAASIFAMSELSTERLRGSTRVFFLGLTEDDRFLWRSNEEEIAQVLSQKEELSMTFFAPATGAAGEQLSPLVELAKLALTPQWYVNEPPLAMSLTQSPLEEFTVPTPTKLAASAVAQYALCPYRYFSRYVLKLQQPEEQHFWQLSPRRLGEFVHRVFELHLLPLFYGTKQADARFEQEIEQIASEFFPSGMHGAFQTMEWRQLRRDLSTALADEVAFLKKHNLQPLQTETLVELDCLLTNGARITIRCRIDRLDRVEGSTTAKPAVDVVDYKTRRGSIDPKYRLQMRTLVQPQLPIYMLAIAQQEKYEPVGAIEVRLRSGKRGGLVRDELAKRFKSQSFAKLPQEEMLPKFASHLQLLLERLSAADFQPAPQDVDQCGVDACPYWAVCRFDKKNDEVDLDEQEEDDAIDATHAPYD